MDRLSRLKGISTELDNQFAVASSGVTVLIDGDILAYNVTAKVAKLETAIRRFQQEVLKATFLVKAQNAIVHLTASSSSKNRRKEIKAAKPYQSNRDGKNKPPLLESLRTSMASDKNWLGSFECYLWEDIEADDALMIDSYRLKEKSVMYSADKDLRQTPYPYYEIRTGITYPTLDGIGWVDRRYTEKGTSCKLTGHGELFLWTQMLCGDKIDNVLGLERLANGRRVGDGTAIDILKPVASREEMIDRVLYHYHSTRQNPVPELWMLYLLQEPDKTAIDYLLELPIPVGYRDWINRQIGEIEWLK